MFIVFDLDGTLSDDTHRAHFRQQNPPDWDAYSEACGDDEPIVYMMELLGVCAKNSEIRVEIWTGRPEGQSSKTNMWLGRYGFTEDSVLRMRPDGDFRPAHVLKGEWVEQFGKPDIVFEDRPSQIEGWHKLGIPVLLYRPVEN